jgi:hypothetical protein
LRPLPILRIQIASQKNSPGMTLTTDLSVRTIIFGLRMFVRGGPSLMTSRLISTLIRFAVVFAVANIASLVFAAPFQPIAGGGDGSVLVESWSTDGGDVFADSVTLSDGFYDAGSNGCTSCNDGTCNSSDCEHCRSGLVNKWLHWRAHQPGHVIARVDTILMWRNAPAYRPLFETSGNQPLLNADDLESDMLVAPRVSLFRTDGCGNSAEITYIYAGNFYSERTLAAGPGGLFLSPPGIYANPPRPISYQTATTKLLGRFQSLEANGRTAIGRGTTQFIAGFRWLQWQESFDAMASATNVGLPPLSFADTFATDCINDLYGGQIGLDTLLLSTGWGWRLEGLVKAGAYYNNAVQTSSYTLVQNPGNDAFREVRVGRSPAGGAFVGEVGLTGVIPIHCNLDFRIGYVGFWLESIAQPTDQLSGQILTQSFQPAGSLNTTGRVVLQGLSLGLEGRW